MSARAHWYIHTAVEFLSTPIKKPGGDNWVKIKLVLNDLKFTHGIKFTFIIDYVYVVKY